MKPEIYNTYIVYTFRTGDGWAPDRYSNDPVKAFDVKNAEQRAVNRLTLKLLHSGTIGRREDLKIHRATVELPTQPGHRVSPSK